MGAVGVWETPGSIYLHPVPVKPPCSRLPSGRHNQLRVGATKALQLATKLTCCRRVY